MFFSRLCLNKRRIIISGVALAVIIILFYFSFGFQRIFTLNLSAVPNRYLVGFIEGLQQEEKSPTYYNWMVDRSRIYLPLKINNAGALFEMRAKRALRQQGYLYAFVNGNKVFMKNIQGFKYEIIRFKIPMEYLDGKNFDIQFRTYSDEARHKRGMRVDWARVTVPEKATIVPTSEQLREFLIFVIFIGAFSLILPIRIKWKAVTALAPIFLYISANFVYRIEASHLIYYLNRYALFPSLIMLFISKLIRIKTNKDSKLINSFKNNFNFTAFNLIFFISQAIRIIGTFYYQYFYPDLRSYHNFMTILENDGIIGFAYWYGHHHLKILYGLPTAFPYSPLFHITIFPLSFIINDYWVLLRAVSTILNSLFVVGIYLFILYFVKDKKAALFGGLFAAFSPVLFNRLFLCMYTALFSGFLSFLVMVFLLFKIRKVDDWKIRWTGIIIITLALLSYPSALVNLLLFFFVLAILLSKLKLGKKKKNKKLINIMPELKPFAVVAVVAIILAFFIYYVYFLKPLVTELVPFLVEKSDAIVWNKNIDRGFFEYLAARMNFYLSIPGILLVFPGLYFLLKTRMAEYNKKFIYAWLVSWLTIYIFAAPQLLSFMLRLGKEELFILPLFAACAGITSSKLWDKKWIIRVLLLILLSVYISLSLFKWAIDIKSFMIFTE